jgi:hypothetical protein
MKTAKYSRSVVFAFVVIVLSGGSVSADNKDGKYCIWNDKKFSEGASFCMWKNLEGTCVNNEWKTTTNGNCAANPSLSPSTGP